MTNLLGYVAGQLGEVSLGENGIGVGGKRRFGDGVGPHIWRHDLAGEAADEDEVTPGRRDLIGRGRLGSSKPQPLFRKTTEILLDKYN